jgi:hypothetical protein
LIEPLGLSLWVKGVALIGFAGAARPTVWLKGPVSDFRNGLAIKASPCVFKPDLR